MSSWVGNPGRPPYVIPRGSAGLKKKAHVGTEGNEQADQAAKEGAAGGSHMKETQTPITWQVAKSKIEEYTTSIPGQFQSLSH